MIPSRTSLEQSVSSKSNVQNIVHVFHTVIMYIKKSLYKQSSQPRMQVPHITGSVFCEA